jgi:hypothetical protein
MLTRLIEEGQYYITPMQDFSPRPQSDTYQSYPRGHAYVALCIVDVWMLLLAYKVFVRRSHKYSVFAVFIWFSYLPYLKSYSEILNP